MKLAATLIICILVFSASLILPGRSSAGPQRQPAFPYNDALVRPRDPASGPAPMASAPPAPGPDDLSEYFMGKVAVGVVLLESDGSIDPSTEDWDAFRQDEVRTQIEAGLTWWTQQDLRAKLSFTFEYHMSVPTGYEPINHNGPFDEYLWINDAMSHLGYTTGDEYTRVSDWSNYLRSSYNANWAFAIFVVDSLNDADGSFTTGYCAYAYLGGPFFIMTYDNDGYSIANMNYVAAHEMAHIFYATDEYNGATERSGYLNVADIEGSGCIMNTGNSWCISDGTIGQLGWRDTDGDGIFDILDEPPTTFLNPYSPDPTNDTSPSYAGVATVVAYTNRNPYGPGNDVTISKITGAQFSFDASPWFVAQPTDGLFNSESEGFRFMTSPLPSGTYAFHARAVNSENNVDIAPPSDALTIDAEKPASAMMPFQSIVNTSLFNLSADASDNLGVQYVDLYYSYESGSPLWFDTVTVAPYNWTVYTAAMDGDGNYSFYSIAVDVAGNWEDPPAVPDLNVLVDTINPTSMLDSLPPYINQSSFAITAHPADQNGISSMEIWMDYQSSGMQLLATLSSPPWDYSVDATMNGDGHYVFYTRATDIAGNVEPQHALPDATTIVDTTPPIAAAIALPQYKNTMGFSVTATASDLNGVDSVALWYRRNGGAWTLFSEKSAAPWIWDFDASTSGEGTYEFVTMAVDNAGNMEQWPSSAEATTMVDVTSPTIDFTAPAVGVWINESHVTVRWTGFDALSGLKECRLQIGGNVWTLAGSSTQYNVDWIDDGVQTAMLTAWDNAGNSASEQMSLMIDTTPPELQFETPDDGGSVDSPANVTWRGTDATSGIDFYEYGVDGGQMVAVGASVTAILDLGPGDHTVIVWAHDRAGNAKSATISFTVRDSSTIASLDVLLPAILIIVVAITIILLLVLKRRKKKEEEEKNAPLPPPPPPPPR